MLYRPLVWWRGYFTALTSTAIPNIYWTAYDAEQRVLEICNALQRIEERELDTVTIEQLNQALGMVDAAIADALSDANNYTDDELSNAIKNLEQQIADITAGQVTVRDVSAGQNIVDVETGIWRAVNQADVFAVTAQDLDAMSIEVQVFDSYELQSAVLDAAATPELAVKIGENAWPQSTTEYRSIGFFRRLKDALK